MNHTELSDLACELASKEAAGIPTTDALDQLRYNGNPLTTDERAEVISHYAIIERHIALKCAGLL